MHPFLREDPDDEVVSRDAIEVPGELRDLLREVEAGHDYLLRRELAGQALALAQSRRVQDRELEDARDLWARLPPGAGLARSDRARFLRELLDQDEDLTDFLRTVLRRREEFGGDEDVVQARLKEAAEMIAFYLGIPGIPPPAPRRTRGPDRGTRKKRATESDVRVERVVRLLRRVYPAGLAGDHVRRRLRPMGKGEASEALKEACRLRDVVCQGKGKNTRYYALKGSPR